MNLNQFVGSTVIQIEAFESDVIELLVTFRFESVQPT